MNYFQDGKIVIDLEKEVNEKVWMIVKTKLRDRTGKTILKEDVNMARDIFGDMTLSMDEELLEPIKYTEDEAEERCRYWSEKLGLENLAEISIIELFSEKH